MWFIQSYQPNFWSFRVTNIWVLLVPVVSCCGGVSGGELPQNIQRHSSTHPRFCVDFPRLFAEAVPWRGIDKGPLKHSPVITWILMLSVLHSCCSDSNPIDVGDVCSQFQENVFLRLASSVLPFKLFNPYLWTVTRSFLALYEIWNRYCLLIFSITVHQSDVWTVLTLQRGGI